MIFGINAYLFTGVIIVGTIFVIVGLKKSNLRRRKDAYDRAGEYMIGVAEALAWDLQYLNQKKDS